MASPREFPRADRHRKRPTFGPARDDLERRDVPAIVGLPSGPPASIPAGAVAPLATASPAGGSHSPTGFTPAQIRAAYGLDRVMFGSVAGDGSGQTIAIVDAYDDPNFVDSSSAGFAASDLAQFDRQFGLPDPPSFTKINQAGQSSSLPSTDPAGAGSPGGNWEDEEAMDVEWAHALAPGASIVVVEANSSNTGDLYSALNVAKGLPGVSAVSLSWGGPEYANESFWDPNFRTPPGHQGVTFVAASGDGGAPGIYPAYAKDVVAVGGTALQLDNDGSIRSETAWSGSGGGISTQEPEPSYQQEVQSTGHRTVPDVSFVASYSTGVATYDSYNDTAGNGPWITMWGTSLGAPSWAALIAVADQGRVAAGGTTLDGFTQTLPALYSAPSADFHDIAIGSNGAYNAGPGYDEVTGLGTPAADLLARDLAFYGMSDHLAITAQPASPMSAGQALGLTVAVERPDGTIDADATGSVTISLATGPAGRLGGTLTAAIDHGVATFSGLSIPQVGSGYSLTASGAGLGSVTSSTFAVAPSVATQLVVTAQPPSGITAGSGFSLAVVAEDAFGNPVTGYSGAVSLVLGGGAAGGHLGGTAIVAASGGVASFSGLSIDLAGAGYTLRATAPGLTSATTNPIAVAASSPSQLVIEAGPPSSVIAGSGFGLNVAVEDPYGNLETGYRGAVTIGLAGGPAGAALDGLTAETVSGGLATFPGLVLTAAGSGYRLEVSGANLTNDRSPSFDVTPAAPARLTITRQPATPLAAGSPFDVGVAVEDAFGNPEPAAEDPVALQLLGGPPGVGLVGTTGVDARDGVATFGGLTLTQVGSSYRIEATSPGLSSATTADLSVKPAAPSHLVITLQPPDEVTAGAGFGLAVAVEDAYGNRTTGYGGDVRVSLENGPAGTRLSGATSQVASLGAATLSGLALNRAGVDVLAVTADGLARLTTSPLRVVAAAPSQLVIVDQPPGHTVAGQPFGFGVALEDRYGNVATGHGGPVTAALAQDPAGGSLLGRISVDAVDGVATFDGLELDLAGEGYSVAAASGGLTSAASRPVAVSPAAPRRLVITSQPPGRAIAGQPFRVGVEAVDAVGNVATGFDGPVMATLVGTGHRDTLREDLTVQASGGRATITGAIPDRPGKSYSITISSAGLTPTVTSVFEAIKPPGRTRAAVRRASRFHHPGHGPGIGQTARTTHERVTKLHAARVHGEGHAHR